jgi:hypothetical protein
MPDRNGLLWSSGAQIWDWNDHDNKTWGNELQIMGGNKMCLSAYWADLTYSGGDGGGFQMGGSGPYNDHFWFQYNTAPENTNAGVSKQVQFRMRSGADTNLSRATVFGRASAPTSPRGRLEFYSGKVDGQTYALSGDAWYAGGMMESGWLLKGGVVQEHAGSTTTSNTFAWDWRAGSSATLLATGDTTIAVTNASSGATNYESRTLLIDVSGSGSRGLTFPASWQWFAEAGPGSAPTNVTAGTLLRVRVENLGGVLCASASYASGTTTVMDADAQAYFSRAGITQTSAKLAINTFVAGLKSAGIWTKMVGLWPMYGSNSTATAQNLVGSSNTITWACALTAASNHTDSVRSPGGLADYGDTGVNPNTCSPSITSSTVHMMVWSKSAAGTGTDDTGSDCAWAIGMKSSPYSKSGIYYSAAKALTAGPGANGSSPSWYVTTNNAAGYLICQGNAVYGTATRGMLGRSQMVPYGGPISTASFPAYPFFVFNYNEDGAAARQGALTLAGASIGQALNSTEESAYYTLWSNLQSELGR